MNVDQNNVPEGMSFLQLIWGQEDACGTRTDEYISGIGDKAPLCLENIGTVLSLLDRMASCWWSCRGGDHMIEYLCGRVASSARAALRLMKFGFYDESLLVCRAIGEIANLFHLFCTDVSALEKWRTSSRKEQFREFSPAVVRRKLKASEGDPVIDEEWYRLLCEKSAHVSPKTKPQSHNVLGIPAAGGGELQPQGLLVCLNEIAFSLAFSTLFSVRLLDYEGGVREQILSSVRDLAEKIGGIRITTVEDYQRRVWEENREELAVISDVLRCLKHARHESGSS